MTKWKGRVMTLGVNPDNHASGIKWSKANPYILSAFPGNGMIRRKVL